MNDDLHLPDGSTALLISSDRRDGINAEAAALADYLDTHVTVSPTDMARMLLRTRPLRRYRGLVRATDRATTIDALHAIAAGARHPHVTVAAEAAAPRRAALVFAGQGSQQAGMGRRFYDRSTVYRRRVDEVNAAFEATTGVSPLTYLLDEEHAEEVTIVQPAIFLHTLGLTEMWLDAGIEPAATVGHSQGEFGAVVASGHVCLSDAIRLVTDRAIGIEKLETNGRHAPSAMAVIGATREQIEEHLARQSGWVELAVVNSTTIHAISGTREAVDAVVEHFRERNVFARRIGVDHAGHSSLLRDYPELFSHSVEDLEASEFSASAIPCIGGTLGGPITPDLPFSDYWYWNLRNPVRFDLAIAAAARTGIDTFVEVSEHPTMLLSISETLSERGIRAVVVGTGKRDTDPLSEFTANFATVVTGDSEFPWPTVRSGDLLPDFPNTRFDDTTYWAASSANALAGSR